LSTPGQEFADVFLQEASERLQFLREYSGILQDPYPVPEAIERLYIFAHALSGSSASYGYTLFSEVASKLSHIFQYAMNAGIAQEAATPLVEFISEAIAVLESDLLMISDRGSENAEEIEIFKQRYPFAFAEGVGPETEPGHEAAPVHLEKTETSPSSPAEAHAMEETGKAGAALPELSSDDDVPAEILEFFVPEAEEHLQIAQQCLLSMEAAHSSEDINRLFRALHTIKGAAAQVGLHRISHVAHAAEDLIGKIRDGELQPTSAIVDLCLELVDAIRKLLHREWPDESALQQAVRPLLGRVAAYVPSEAAESAPKPESTSYSAETRTTGVHAPTATHEDDAELHADGPADSDVAEPEVIAGLRNKEPAALPQSKSVRIALERLDRMMNAVGELVINRTRMLGRLAELERLADVLTFSKGRMQDKIGEFQEKYEFSRLTTTLTNPATLTEKSAVRSYPEFETPGFGFSEFSELEMDRYDDFNILARSLTEISADITEVLSQLDGFVRRVDADIDEFTKLAHRLQDDITQARMVPIGNLYTRISRTVRDAAKATNKQVELALSGAETELDNNIIQQISDPLIHLVRNAVAHGLESAEERYNSGKSDHGNVAVRAYHRGNHIFIEVEDDGGGIEFERVRAKAVEQGIVTTENAPQLSERDLLEILFHPGFSTASRKTELAGRGVGLDVVRSNLTALNGEIDIETQQGLGTRFTMKVPLTLIISQALFVRCGNHMFAMPLAFVEEIRRLRDADVEEVGGKLLTKVRDVVTEVVRLDVQLGLERVQPVNGFYRLVIANIAGRQVGIVVEEVLRKDEIVIKNLGPYLRNVKMFPGATIAPDGSLILLIDVNRLVVGESIERRPLMTVAATRIFAPGAAAVASGTIPQGAIEPVVEEKVVILADDSISIRKFVGRMLEKAGYRVKLASDGLEALEIALQTKCDLVITDLEMPRTNGYELLTHLRQNPETHDIPVMVVTSRAGAKHRERALKDGARAFLIKPVQEDQFIATVYDLIGPGATTAKSAMTATV
jgi:chemosensory pili system protein ChpA (sensor histidine kinase/response regulator)